MASKIPPFFKPILWSYDFSRLSPKKDAKTIIVQAINYGDLAHWRWLVRHFGKRGVKEVLESVSSTEIRGRVRKLAALVFGVSRFNHAPRGTRSKK